MFVHPIPGTTAVEKMLLHKMLAVSVVVFVAQLRKPCKNIKHYMMKGVSKIFNGPYNPASLDFWCISRRFKFFPMKFLDIHAVSLAIRARTMVTVLSDAR